MVLPASAMDVPTMAIATPTIRMWPSTFCQAMRRRLSGAATRMSMLPRRLSPAKVAESARIDHRPVTSGRKPPYLYWM